MFSKTKKYIGESVDSKALQDKGNELIEEELPKIQAHFREKVGSAAAEKIQDDKFGLYRKQAKHNFAFDS